MSAVQGPHARGGVAKERRGSLYEVEALDDLTEGSVVADRFRIGRQLEGKPHCRRATDLSTGKFVFPKFYPSSGQEFQNATRMHRALRANGRVCKMLETLTGKNGFPPCLVLEAGSFTLEHRLGGRRPTPVERRALVHSVLETVAELHAQKVVHGNLYPSHLVWFPTDFAWKLVDLYTAATIGDEVLFEHITSRR